MTTFDDREKAFEKKYEHDQDLQFKVEVRRNKLLGLWAAELLGLASSAADSYAKEVVASDFQEPGDADLVGKVLEDFKKGGVDINEHQLRKQLSALEEEAKRQIMTE